MLSMNKKLTEDEITHITQNENDEVTTLFNSLHDEKVNSIKELIEDIQHLIIERKELEKEVFSDFNKIQLKLGNVIGERKDDLKIEEIINLQKKLIEIEEEKTREKINSWKDIALLKKELREHKKELKEKEDNKKMLDSMATF